MSQYFGVELVEKNPKAFQKDLAWFLQTKDIVGDAKFLTLVHRTKTPHLR